MNFPFLKIIRFIISLGLLLFLFIKFGDDFDGIQQHLKEPNLLWFSFFIVVLIIPIIVINRWKYLLSLIGIKEKFFSLYKITHLSQFYGLLFPSSSGFIAVKIFLIEKKYPSHRGKVGSTVFIEKAFGVFILTLIGVLGSFLIPNMPKLTIIQITMVSILFGVLLFFYFLRSSQFPKIISWLSSRNPGSFFKKGFDYFLKFILAIAQFPIKKAFVASAILILLFQLSTILNVHILFQVYGNNVPFIYHLGFLPIVFIFSMLPVSIGGLGVREGFFVYFYGLIGVDPSLALLVSLSNYLILSVTPAMIGGILSFFVSFKNYPANLPKNGKG